MLNFSDEGAQSQRRYCSVLPARGAQLERYIQDADEDDIDLYNEKMERYEAYEGIINAVDKWIEKVGRIAA